MSLEEQVGRIATALERLATAMEASTSHPATPDEVSAEAQQAAADAVAKAAEKAGGKTRRTGRGSTEKEANPGPEQQGSAGASTETPSASTPSAGAPEPTPEGVQPPANEESPVGRTVAEVQTLATSIAERFGRAKALAVVNSYAPRVSAIPAEKLTACFDQLKQVEADLEALS